MPDEYPGLIDFGQPFHRPILRKRQRKVKSQVLGENETSSALMWLIKLHRHPDMKTQEQFSSFLTFAGPLSFTYKPQYYLNLNINKGSDNFNSVFLFE